MEADFTPERGAMLFYKSFYDAIECCPPGHQLNLYRAIVLYGLTGEAPTLDGVENAIFLMAKPQLDTNNRKYRSGLKGAAHGRLGGAPVGNRNAAKNNPAETTKTTPKQPQNNPKTTPKEKDKEKEKEKDKENSLSRVVVVAREAADNNDNNNDNNPTKEEIFDFFKSEGLESSPEAFHAYNEARGWRIGERPITDWKAAARLWESREDKADRPTATHQTDKAPRNAIDRWKNHKLPPEATSATAADIEAMRQTARRHAEEEAARKAREAKENPDGLSPAQALADFKRRNGLSPDQSPADLLGPPDTPPDTPRRW